VRTTGRVELVAPREDVWTADVSLAGPAAALEGCLADGTADRAVAGVLDCVQARLEA
jgi:hypothetical protein